MKRDDMSFGTHEALHDLAAYLARTVELYGQNGTMTPSEFFLEALYDWYEKRPF